ncbi:hypothetical protein MHBO_001823 [Bonamia ostreae]|uniref:DUF4460 domain-containing protein n=1 Tax=Bonamia ostreae TaxID=126728 RepID=A0ABV2ALD4_9EUKA
MADEPEKLPLENQKTFLKKVSIPAKELLKVERNHKRDSKTRAEWRKKKILIRKSPLKSKNNDCSVSTWRKFEKKLNSKNEIFGNKENLRKAPIDEEALKRMYEQFGESTVDTILKFIDKNNFNFYVTTSKLNFDLKKKMTLEEIKNIYFSIHPDLLAKSKFNFNLERIRKKELNLLHRRTTATEEKILDLSLEKKALYEVFDFHFANHFASLCSICC